MDLILFIIALVFVFDKNNTHNYTALIVLSIIGLIITFILGMFVNWLFLIDGALYGITLLISACASNKTESR